MPFICSFHSTTTRPAASVHAKLSSYPRNCSSEDFFLMENLFYGCQLARGHQTKFFYCPSVSMAMNTRWQYYDKMRWIKQSVNTQNGYIKTTVVSYI